MDAPAIYAACRVRDGSNAVERKVKLEEEEAVARRRAGEDIVVCGPDTVRNDTLAKKIEEAAAPPGVNCIYHGPDGDPLSLPHWQQDCPLSKGHSFHETTWQQARRTL
jgi:hypothetical protein